MKNAVLTIMLSCCVGMYAQITFNACHPLLEDQNYTVNNVGTDSTGRNIFETTPLTGDQPCSGVGVCELRFAWNDTASQWEIIADDGNGDFSGTFLLYSNIEASSPNPPSLDLGVWVENTAVTSNNCGGDLTNMNAVLTGDVQNTLSTAQFGLGSLAVLYPNPMSDKLNVDMGAVLDGEAKFTIYSLSGVKVRSFSTSADRILDVSDMASGMYFVKLQVNDKTYTQKLIKQ